MVQKSLRIRCNIKIMGLEQIRLLKAQALMPKQAKRYTIPKKSAKKIQREKEEKELGTDKEMNRFFEAMRKRCKCKCLFCGAPTTSKNEELWRIAIAHLMPKNHFKSIATNENNWIELCWDCHTSFDSAKITWEFIRDSFEWLAIKEKLFEILPLVAPEERKHKLYSKLQNLVYEDTRKLD